MSDTTETLATLAPPVTAGGSGPFSARYLSFAAAMSFSSLGDSAWYIALTWTLIRTTSPSQTGLFLAVAGLPRLIMLLGGGVVADRYGPKRLMVYADVLRCAVMLLAATLIAVNGNSISLLFGAALLLALFSAFFIPASGAVRPLLFADKDLVRGNAMFTFGSRGGQALGSPIGAGVVAAVGMPAVALINAASFAVSAYAAWRVRYLRAPSAQPAQRPPFFSSVAEGFRYLRTEQRLAVVMLMVGLTELSCAAPVNIGLVLLAPRLHSAVAGAGLLLTAYTVGAIASTVITMLWPPTRRSGSSLMLGTLVAGVAVCALGFLRSLPIALLVYLAMGLSTGQFSVVLVSMLQRWCDRAVLGRVMAVFSIITFGAVPISNLLIGMLVEYTGLGVGMASIGVLCLVCTALAAGHPQLRRARLD
jgi:MFS family permease